MKISRNNFSRKPQREKEKKIKIALISAVVLLVGFFFLWKTTKRSDEKSAINVPETDFNFKLYQSLVPIRNWEIEAPNIEARAAAVVFVDSSGNQKFIFEKNKNLKLPIASITKIMTALIVLKEYNLEEVIVVTEEAFLRDISRINNFYVGEQYKAKDLLYPLLMESSNTAAYALAQRANNLSTEAQTGSVASFVALMNRKAQELGMKDTYFVNPSGLDPLSAEEVANYSTAKDLAILVEYLFDKPLIWEILSLPEFELFRLDGFLKHRIISTNILLSEMPEILGGKTGTTSRAMQTLVLVVPKDGQGHLICIILGSRDRFNEAREMLDWAEKGYIWDKTEVK